MTFTRRTLLRAAPVVFAAPLAALAPAAPEYAWRRVWATFSTVPIAAPSRAYLHTVMGPATRGWRERSGSETRVDGVRYWRTVEFLEPL